MKPGKETTAVDLTREGILSRVCGRRSFLAWVMPGRFAGWGMDCFGGLLLGTAFGDCYSGLRWDASLAWRRTELGRSVRCVSVQRRSVRERLTTVDKGRR